MLYDKIIQYLCRKIQYGALVYNRYRRYYATYIIYHFSQVLCPMHLLNLCSLFLQLSKVYLTNSHLTKSLFTQSYYSLVVEIIHKMSSSQQNIVTIKFVLTSQATFQKLSFIHSIIIVYSSWKKFVRKVLSYTQPCF